MRLLVFLLLPCAAWAAGPGTVEFRPDTQLAGLLGLEPLSGTHMVRSNTLTFSSSDFERFSGGAIYLDEITLTAIPDSRGLAMTGGYTIENPHIGWHSNRLFIVNADVRHGDYYVAETHIEVDYPLPPPPPGDLPCVTNFGPGTYDVALVALSNLQQRAREPGVRVALAPATRLKNVGAYSVPWFWMIPPPRFAFISVTGQHPYVIFNFYRLMSNELVQIGRSDAKHAFYSTNEDCPCAGAQTIFPDCLDTYGFANNSDTYYFGPRHEITANTGFWSPLGSHFDDVPADHYRDHVAETDGFSHRLVVREADLAPTNAQYFLEAWYLVQGDTNIFNSMGHRRATPALTGTGIWNFTFTTALITGPVIRSWAARTNVVVDTGEGRFQLASFSTNLGGGMHRFHYSIANHDFDRQIGRFSVPVSPGANPTNAFFFDGDTSATNDWTFFVTNGAAVWQAPGTNGLDWGTLYSFRMDAAAPPVEIGAELSAVESGAPDAFLVPSLAPVLPIADVALDGSGAPKVQWPATSGTVYQLQAAPELTSDWTAVGGPVTAQAAMAAAVDTNQTAIRKFYRLRIGPAP